MRIFFVYSSADYFFIFQDKYADIMMVESAKKKAKIQKSEYQRTVEKVIGEENPEKCGAV